ncbi:hypothetical protein L227DRAFT_613051 [Lentinus tigrinus ALCF2SS1-6]|uniref:Uncharacterized protein n=1 Tax=Lentinus tigrinus ALCF2SS1-6 TaxID=1328759 RepID=A0A5C2S445_9APHY|nr:hypothetical protein L227DRAFT_613051 [Lentinus tigrinus ALCF2SS1-6]
MSTISPPWVPSSSSTTPRPPSRSFVSTYTNGNGSDDWSTLTPSARDPRSWGGWELVAFKNAHDSDRAGKYVPVSSQVVFTDLENIEVE